MDEFDENAVTSLSQDSWSAVEETRVLLVTPHQPDVAFQETLESEGCVVSREAEFAQTEDLSELSEFDVLIVDVDALDGDVEFPQPARPGPVRLLRVDRIGPRHIRQLLRYDFDSLLRRDSSPESHLRLIEQELRHQDDETDGELNPLGHFVGESDAMRHVCRRIAGAAPSSASVLIGGESGVGKELVARAIHRLSPRRRRPFVALNCGAIPENLIESELFGHVEGAFTGAISSRRGRFEQADTGTLFLDEIGELPGQMQVKLLRVLEEQTFEPVGGNEQVSVDVRILSATNRDLSTHIENQDFRRDLYFRLNVLEIDVPPLRQRPDDIQPLWSYFVHRAATEEARQPPETSQSAVRQLYQYDWPGNVRELRNVAHHAVAFLMGDTITVDQLPERFREKLADQTQSSPAGVQIPGMTLEQVERAAIIGTHEWTSDASETADMLDISERKVYYKLKEYREQGYLEPDGGETDAKDESTSDSADTTTRLIIAEDDRELMWTLDKTLRDDYDIVKVTSGRQLVEEVESEKPDLILSDIRMPGLDGIQILRESHNSQWDVPIVLMSAFGDEDTRSQAETLGATALLEKPVDADVLQRELEQALRGTED